MNSVGSKDGSVEPSRVRSRALRWPGQVKCKEHGAEENILLQYKNTDTSKATPPGAQKPPDCLHPLNITGVRSPSPIRRRCVGSWRSVRINPGDKLIEDMVHSVLTERIACPIHASLRVDGSRSPGAGWRSLHRLWRELLLAGHCVDRRPVWHLGRRLRMTRRRAERTCAVRPTLLLDRGRADDGRMLRDIVLLAACVRRCNGIAGRSGGWEV